MLKSINLSALFAVVAALIAGLAKIEDIRSIDTTTLIFAAFLLLLRFKTFFDDSAYFKVVDINTPHFKVGFILAILSWVLWALAAYEISLVESRISFFLLGCSIGISVIWIIAVALRSGASREQYYWIATNIIYIVILWTLQKYGNLMPQTFQIMTALVLIVVLIIDYIISKSMGQVSKE